MGYQALYRVWRPQTFEDVVGQQHVTQTLQNALLQDKISHAYLFSGPRGTGKTSAAKILGKAVNCERAPIAEPCNECAACKGIMDGSIQDVIEIDAASNNGVEEIRDIRDKVKFAPSAVPFKVYIIDEVHMLSIGAFNALLKTLEEPPKHVMFILATTEPHKIPLTIISRCQRFDFKRITPRDIVGRMSYIANESGVDVEEQALHVIARAAEGGMRDALSLLDQAISFSDDKVMVGDALTVTGAVAQVHLNQLAKAIHEKEASNALESLEELVNQGKDPSRLVEDLIMYFRDMLLFKTAPSLEQSLERVLLDEQFQSLAESIQPEQIYEYIDILNHAQQEMRFTNHTKIYLEVSLVKLSQLNVSHQVAQSIEVEQLTNKIEQLERALKDIQQKGLVVQGQSEAAPSSPQKKTPRTQRMKIPVGRIHDILSQATKQDLQLLKSRWGDMLQQLNQRQMRSQAALLNDAEPVAASSKAFVLKFKYQIHCQMAMDNQQFVESIATILEGLIGLRLEIVGVPEENWSDIRKEFLQTNQSDDESPDTDQSSKPDDPLLSEALKLVGSDLLEIKE
ncbi:DNA polymerase III subunit gamma/tau [Bacillus coahuilensis p1.1.43]|uniref:DNA-directed DNA polymerase n=1 Tax=Bacillus coahuilensis p1.1.43 TaxID=1150625 RepID=A0A147K3K2_9BACI|nr:DNA polymerase III subunit gamma/tau [Bacillus coahuilensis]KUP03894.1 DNA polymerase III subunit gamma/tau [Bacillus coahuilensis p1.1.43]